MCIFPSFLAEKLNILMTWTFQKIVMFVSRLLCVVVTEGFYMYSTHSGINTVITDLFLLTYCSCFFSPGTNSRARI